MEVFKNEESMIYFVILHNLLSLANNFRTSHSRAFWKTKALSTLF